LTQTGPRLRRGYQGHGIRDATKAKTLRNLVPVRGLLLYPLRDRIRLNRGEMGHVAAEFLAQCSCVIRVNLLSTSIMVQKYLRPAAIKAGVIEEAERVRFGFHNFRHSLASSVVKLKCDPKTVQGILRHEDVRRIMQLYAQSDQESRLEAQGKFLALLLGDKAHLLTEAIQ
jgi:integrase